MTQLYSDILLGELIQEVTEAKFDDVPKKLQQLIHYLMEMVGADRMTLGRLLSDERIEFISVRRAGVRKFLDSDDFVAVHRPIDSILVDLIKKGQKRIFDSSLVNEFGKPEKLEYYGIHDVTGFVQIPIALRGEPWGQITCARFSSHDGWDETLVDMLQQVSITVAAVYERYLFFREAMDQKQRAEQLSRALLENQESERRFISQELHDNFSQQMALITLESHVLMDKLGLPPEQGQMMVALQNRIESLAANMQQLSRSLHPKILQDLGFEPALAAECRRIESLTPITCHLFIDTSVSDQLSNTVLLNLYRVTQEALANIVKHSSSAESVLISLSIEDEDVVFSIRDDGEGSSATQHAGLGLTSISERAIQCGGVARFITAHNEGFEIEIRLPISIDFKEQQ
ncbi:sensor histidine kinase [Vibrio maritimus]|uniref:histidine kinase n=1 Tax=Vibrio maritimus TaxID=990268 RepID=A0A090RWU7_9VIBR|nr:sensor histidine kinase [Vibrio maritimus]